MLSYLTKKLFRPVWSQSCSFISRCLKIFQSGYKEHSVWQCLFFKVWLPSVKVWWQVATGMEKGIPKVFERGRLFFCFVCLENKLFGKCDLWLSVGLIFSYCLHEAAPYRSHRIQGSVETVSASALVCGSQTVLHLYWNFQVLSVLLLASAQHWALIL